MYCAVPIEIEWRKLRSNISWKQTGKKYSLSHTISSFVKTKYISWLKQWEFSVWECLHRFIKKKNLFLGQTNLHSQFIFGCSSFNKIFFGLQFWSKVWLYHKDIIDWNEKRERVGYDRHKLSLPFSQGLQWNGFYPTNIRADHTASTFFST